MRSDEKEQVIFKRKWSLVLFHSCIGQCHFRSEGALIGIWTPITKHHSIRSAYREGVAYWKEGAKIESLRNL